MLCRLDVLRLQDSLTGDQGEVYKEFQEQLQRSVGGWYETTFPCLFLKVIKDQLEKGIVERAEEIPKGQEFYIPQKPIVRESAESTKLRGEYDASAPASENSRSINECIGDECIGERGFIQFWSQETWNKYSYK